MKPILATLALLFLLAPKSVRLHAEEFPAPYNSEEASKQPLSPAEALRAMRLPEGYSATLFAAEPDVLQPIAMSFDERGRLWVVECHTYAEATRNFDTNLRDRVIILEDTDGDGRQDNRKVFWDQGRKLTSVEHGLGGVWLLAPPQLLFIPDKNRDDIPDAEPVVILDGFKESAIRHNIANGLKWGPDGWLYGRQGILETSLVGTPAASPSQRTSINCGVWRVHPITHKVEVVLRGTTNPWGFDYDDSGELFIINTVIGHLWHVVSGARTERMYGTDPNPYSYELMGQVADHVHWNTTEQWLDVRKGVTSATSQAGGGHAHSGLVIYQGDNWPAEMRGSPLTINFHGRRINHDRLAPKGSTYTARHEPDVLFWDDPWFRGIDLATGPDGALFVLDWSDTGECHEQDGIHRTSGRVYKIAYRQPKPLTPFDLGTRSSEELIDLQTHTNDWWTRQARRLLRDRATNKDNLAAANARAHTLLKSNITAHALRALWSLEATGAANDALLTQLLAHDNELLRAWAVRLLTQSDFPSRSAKLAKHAETESSPRVLLHLASALQSIPLADRPALARPLLQSALTANDRPLLLLTWYGIEPLLVSQPELPLEFLHLTSSPILRQFIARRVAEELDAKPEMLNALLANANADALPDVLLGMARALKGWAKATPPSAFASAATRSDKTSSPELKEALLELGLLFGDDRSMDQLKTQVETGATGDRLRALHALASIKDNNTADYLFRWLDDRDIRIEAIKGLAAQAHADIPNQLLRRWSGWTDAEKAAVLTTLVTRKEFAQPLLDAMRAKTISPRDLSPYQARQIRDLNDPVLTADLAATWGDIRPSSADRQALFSRYQSLLTDERLAAAKPEQGRALFTKHCANCHVLFGTGRLLGPDLTGSNRKNLAYLLENIIDPSAVVAADFRASLLLMEDGRSLTGYLTKTGQRSLLLKTQQEDLPLDANDVEEIRPTPLSLMPDGLLQNLSENETVDLFSYLMSD